MRFDPLSEWLGYFNSFKDGVPSKRVGRFYSSLGRDVDKMAALFNAPRLKGTALQRAERLTRHIIEQGGSGSIHAQDILIEHIACMVNPSSIPFWLGMLDWKRKREAGSYPAKRRLYACCALALLALISKEEAAYEALQQAMYHDNPTVRGLALHYLGHAYYDAVQGESGEVLRYHRRTRSLFDEPHRFRPVPKQVVKKLHEIATLDDAFAPRFQARELLRLLDEPVPMDHPDGSFAFKVKFWWHKRTFRTIEMRSTHTLEDLFYAIQQAIGWNTDHLYFFSLNSSTEDRISRFVSPWASDYPITSNAIIGEMGFVKKHKFLYYFDFGASHRFEVEVVNIKPQADNGVYPRLIKSKGEAPAQYY